VFISLDGDHPTDWVTTYPLSKKFFGVDKHGSPRGKGDVVIGNDVWIGGGVLIMGGVTIGDGAVIGARSVVTHNVNDYEIVAGNPARHIRFRFEPLLIDQLKRVKWWDWQVERVRKYAGLLESGNVKEFLDASLYCGIREDAEGNVYNLWKAECE
jgi:tetrahydrodipicolinate N-succinyltransferase